VIAGQIKASHLRAIAALSIATVGAAPFALNSLAQHGYAVPTLAAGERLMAMLDARSPGERASGELSATKIKAHKIAIARQPSERALGKIVRPAPVTSPEFVAAVTPKSSEVAMAAAPFGPVTLADVVTPVAAARPLGGVVGGGGGVILSAPGGGGGGGGGGTSGVTDAPQVPTQITASVPEPATWITMLIGFGVIGAGQRRRRIAPNAKLGVT
jgi:PEP-CTERM motif